MTDSFWNILYFVATSHFLCILLFSLLLHVYCYKWHGIGVLVAGELADVAVLYIWQHCICCNESVHCVVTKVLVMMLFAVNSVLLQQECAFLENIYVIVLVLLCNSMVSFCCGLIVSVFYNWEASCCSCRSSFCRHLVLVCLHCMYLR